VVWIVILKGGCLRAISSSYQSGHSPAFSGENSETPWRVQAAIRVSPPKFGSKSGWCIVSLSGLDWMRWSIWLPTFSGWLLATIVFWSWKMSGSPFDIVTQIRGRNVIANWEPKISFTASFSMSCPIILWKSDITGCSVQVCDQSWILSEKSWKMKIPHCSRVQRNLAISPIQIAWARNLLKVLAVHFADSSWLLFLLSLPQVFLLPEFCYENFQDRYRSRSQIHRGYYSVCPFEKNVSKIQFTMDTWRKHLSDWIFCVHLSPAQFESLSVWGFYTELNHLNSK